MLSRRVSGCHGDQDSKRPHVYKKAQRAFFWGVFLRSQQEQPILLLLQKYLLHNTVQAFAPPIISVRDVVVV